jgi:hypothetical protein
MSIHPELSVVVIPLIGQDALASCLDRLPLETVECIVVLRTSMRAASHWERRYPSVTFVDTDDEPVPLRRLRGVAIAKGDVVGLIEDTSWPAEGWCAAVQSAFRNKQTAAAGGPVKIAATLPSRYQALGWSEYGRFASSRTPVASLNSSKHEGSITTSRVPGNNMAFRRLEVLELLREEDNGFFEGPICARLRAQGRKILYQPQMLVTYSTCDPHNASLATRLHHGRLYASSQVQGKGWTSRLTHLAKTPLLPIVLTGRAVAAMTGSERLSARLRVLFWLSLIESAWSIGEAVGSLAGAGESIKEWR